MIYPSIRIEGAILAPDILERLEEASGQRPADFGMDRGGKVKDEIARAWADAQDYWRIFQRRIESLKPGAVGTTETRQQWIVPLLGLFGYQLEYQARGTVLNGKNYPISHRAANRADTPVHIQGCLEPAGLDRKPEKGAALRISAHAMVQEYLNLKEQLYGLVTNGRLLRLLRDSSRLVKLTYLEFDLDRIFTDGLFADFALLYRLLHATRLPVSVESAAESLIERYHQDSLDSGARIRDGLSRAVKTAIRDFANGFLSHPANVELQEGVAAGRIRPEDYYQSLLRLIYRILFLMVIEERNLVFAQGVETRHHDIYRHCYSLQRLRRLSEKRFLADPRRHDLWLSLLATFRLFEAGGLGHKLGITPLDGDLFDPGALGIFGRSTLGNDVLLGCLRALGLYRHPDTGQLLRVNYAALNVEEFGSVYEGLLEFEPVFLPLGRTVGFDLAKGDQRAATGAHYTPDDLVQPLIKHALDPRIKEKLKAPDPEKALLSLRVADIACGSGHILLAAARRIATELAVVRTGEEQPAPPAFRAAVRDVIHECIYGVDLNPLAVELCKVALWLEAHNPGQPLNFLDHHIRCGNAVVGYVRREEVDQGVPDAAFATMPGDDKKVAASFRKQNKEERRPHKQRKIELSPEIEKQLEAILARWQQIEALPERSPKDIAAKKKRYLDFTRGEDASFFGQIAAIPIAQFYLPKTPENQAKIITDEQFQRYWSGERHPQGQATAEAWAIAFEKRFFHWFLEFPEIIENGGFDCILGNPPYLGGQALSGTYGHPFCRNVKWGFAPAGLSDLVVYFVRRIYGLLRPGGLTGFITTNSIKDGDIRKDGLEQVLAQGGSINFAVRGIRWPGRANLVVSLVAIHKGEWTGRRVLDGSDVDFISAFLDDNPDGGEPRTLTENADRIFQGSIFLGDGFLLTHEEAEQLIKEDTRNLEVIFPVINGQEANNKPDQAPGRSIINFFDWEMVKAQEYELPFGIVEEKVKPKRAKDNRALYRNRWWQYAEPRRKLREALPGINFCFIAAATTKYLNFSAAPTNYVFTHALYVFATDRWDLYSVAQSTLHEVCARKFSGALKQDLRYSPSKCFNTFPFPEGLWQATNSGLAAIGEQYHEHRRALMLSLRLGLTKLYNLFHTRTLAPEQVAKVSKQPSEIAEAGFQGILELRRLHEKLDNAVRDAYGWSDLNLGHDFVEVDTLPENDRVRFTLSPAALKEVLRRLLALNLKRAAEQPPAPPPAKKRKKKASSTDNRQRSLF
jgi:Eco57I restriction-modification methylase/MmeI, target recognition domain